MTDLISSASELEYLQSPTITKLMPALIDAIGEFDPVLKDATNPHFRSKYSSLSSVQRAITPALHKHRLMQSQPTNYDPHTGKNVVITRIVHESGEWIAARWVITPVKADPQGEGSALSYARRYTLTSLLGISAEDDDGQAASTREERQAAPRQQATPPAPPAQPSGRDWAKEIVQLATNEKVAPADRRGQLLAAMEECKAFGELTDDMRALFIQHGNEVRAAAEAAAAK